MAWDTLLAVVGCGLVAYAWGGYPALLWCARRLAHRPIRRRPIEPSVSLILAVHNEEECIREKLENCLELNYPPDKLEMVVVSDGSDDATEAIVADFAVREPRIRLLRTAGRAGKSGAQNLGVAHARGDILFFTDARTRVAPGGLKLLVSNFADAAVGGVIAVIGFGAPQSSIGKGQDFYWRFEYWLRQLESDLGVLSHGAGQAMAFRRELFRPLPSYCGDDGILPKDARLQGYRVVQDPRVEASDTLPHTVEGELRARIRMTARNWVGVRSRSELLNPFRFPGTALAVLSHKVLRWLTPVFLLVVLAASTSLAGRGQAGVFWLLQLMFYASALLGWRLARRGRRALLFGLPFAFCLANVGFLLGGLKALRGQKIVAY
ncbi:MAG: glycosyltransferase [Candidatus Acidoferrales bacterium]